jgi:hypothetical protein
MYHGGTLEHGQVLDFKRNLLLGGNILNQGKGQTISDTFIGLNRPSNVLRDYTSSEPVIPGD